MERIRRNAQIAHEDTAQDANPRTGYSPDRPWDWVWAAALGDTGRGFWESEVHRPAVFFLARIKSRNETILDGTTVFSGLTAAGTGDGGAAKRVAPKKKPKKERAAKAPKAPPKKESDASRNASEVCKNFSLGKRSTRVRSDGFIRGAPRRTTRARAGARAPTSRSSSERLREQLIPRAPVAHSFPNLQSPRPVTRGTAGLQLSIICSQVERIGWTAYSPSSNSPESIVWTWTSRT